MNEEMLMNEDEDNVYVFVTNLSRRVNAEKLKWLFDDYGSVEDVNIWVDYESSSMRFAIIEMPADDAKKAIKKLDRTKFFGRRLWIEKAPEVFGVLRQVCAEAPYHRGTYRPLSLDAS
jgi:RNA recognition motif-containing protein